LTKFLLQQHSINTGFDGVASFSMGAICKFKKYQPSKIILDNFLWLGVVGDWKTKLSTSTELE